MHCNFCTGLAIDFKGYRRNVHNSDMVKICQCKTCGLIFPDPMPEYEQPTELYSDIEYFKLHDIENKLSHTKSLLLRLENISGQKGSLLDIASGRGEMVRTAQELGWQANGIDISVAFCKHVKQQYDIDVINADFLEYEFRQQYDAVFANAVLEHVSDPRFFLEKTYNLLKPNGVLYLDVPNEASLYSLVGNLYYMLTFRNLCINIAPTFSPYHLYGFTEKSLLYIFDKLGFELIQMSTIGKCYVENNSWNMLEKTGARIVDLLSGSFDMKPHFSVFIRKKT
jgi:SAM-dependent methyltransferase